MADYTKSWLQVEESLGGVRPVLNGTAEEMRAQFAGLGGYLASVSPPLSDDVATEDGQVGGIAYRRYTPRALGSQKSVGVFYHSGGFVLGSLDSDDAFCRTAALQCNIIIVSVDYRLAPEHKAPAQLNDATALLEWAYVNALGNNEKPSNFLVIGMSAGGNLALSVTRKVVLGETSLAKDAIDGVFALCPMVLHPDNVPASYKSLHTSYEENEENVPVINKTSLLQFSELAQLQPTDQDTFAFLDEKALRLFPRTYVTTADKDPLRDDGKVLIKALSTLGVESKSDHYAGLPHCFWLFPTLPETEVFFKNVRDAVSWILG